MKKIFVGLVAVFILTVAFFGVKTTEYFTEVKVTDVVNSNVNLIKKENANIVKEGTVRIVILGNNYTSVYHSSVHLTADNLKVYYGEKMNSIRNCSDITLDLHSSVFNHNNVVKIEGNPVLVWEDYDVLNRNKKYDGILYLYKRSSGIVVVNEIKESDYIAGVVSSEIGEESPMEALKAQAVCARTYINSINSDNYKEYNATADDSTAFQVYNKIYPGKKSRKAAKDTIGEIMTYKGKPIHAYYFSTSCGYTTDYKIWGREKLKYLAGCSILNTQLDISSETGFHDFITKKYNSLEKKYPYYRWNLVLSSEQMSNSIYRATGTNIGKVQAVEINRRGTGGIVSQITVYGSLRQIAMSNQNQIRKALCSYYCEIKLNDGSTRSGMNMLPSAFIYIKSLTGNDGEKSFKIYGGGFGHGSGLSQNGAKEMAKKGSDYRKILKYYYNGIKIVNQ